MGTSPEKSQSLTVPKPFPSAAFTAPTGATPPGGPRSSSSSSGAGGEGGSRSPSRPEPKPRLRRGRGLRTLVRGWAVRPVARRSRARHPPRGHRPLDRPHPPRLRAHAEGAADHARPVRGRAAGPRVPSDRGRGPPGCPTSSSSVWPRASGGPSSARCAGATLTSATGGHTRGHTPATTAPSIGQRVGTTARSPSSRCARRP